MRSKKFIMIIYFYARVKNFLLKVMENENWHAKLSAINIIQSFGIFNLFHLSADIKEQVKDIITKYLIDEQLEVRLACALTLTGFIHSSLIQVDEKLIVNLSNYFIFILFLLFLIFFKNDFKKLSRTKIKSKDNEGKLILNTQNLVKRHGGLLGLCAIASSSPYEVPSYLPDIITYLCAFINDTAPIQVIFLNNLKYLVIKTIIFIH
jgi:proteasome activator subunit 4